MTTLETDYLVVGAGASGMAFTDALITNADADVILVDRRPRPGGHWNDDYPFIRLHQPSAYYGVDSVPLGNDTIDTVGSNAGFYERATGPEVCGYYGRVLDQHMVPTGRVRFLGTTDYLGRDGDGHAMRSRLTGETTVVRARRKLVDATALETTIPSRHRPAFAVAEGVRSLTPNQLADLGDAPSGFTVLGAGKTSMDVCCWLIESGVSPDAISWVRPRDSWTVDRAGVQPLTQMASIAGWLAAHNEAAAEAGDVDEVVDRLESLGVFFRLDPTVRPEIYRGAILSEYERGMLRQIGDVIRLGRVLGITPTELTCERGTVPADPGRIYVDCTASGLGMPPARPIFDADRITIQRMRFGLDPFNAAAVGVVEALERPDDEKNLLCPPLAFSSLAADYPVSMLASLRLQEGFGREPEVRRWTLNTRLTPFRDAAIHLATPEASAAFTRMAETNDAAIANLERLLAFDPANA